MVTEWSDIWLKQSSVTSSWSSTKCITLNPTRPPLQTVSNKNLWKRVLTLWLTGVEWWRAETKHWLSLPISQLNQLVALCVFVLGILRPQRWSSLGILCLLSLSPWKIVILSMSLCHLSSFLFSSLGSSSTSWLWTTSVHSVNCLSCVLWHVIISHGSKHLSWGLPDEDATLRTAAHNELLVGCDSDLNFTSTDTLVAIEIKILTLKNERPNLIQIWITGHPHDFEKV